jgi:hypothetical protein
LQSAVDISKMTKMTKRADLVSDPVVEDPGKNGREITDMVQHADNTVAVPAGRRGFVVTTLVVLSCAAIAAWRFWPAPPDVGDEPVLAGTNGDQSVAGHSGGSPAEAARKMTRMSDANLRSRIVADWELNLDGVRRLTVRADGTATLDYRPNAAYSWILGERVQIEIEWKLSDGKGLFRSIRGKPEAAFEWISTFKGTENVWEIIELDKRHALMWDEKDQSHFDWKRVPPRGSDHADDLKAGTEATPAPGSS